MAERRPQYTTEESKKMILFWHKELERGNIDAWSPKGDQLWTKAEKKNITNRTYQSMRDHMRRVVLKRDLVGNFVGESKRKRIYELYSDKSKLDRSVANVRASRRDGDNDDDQEKDEDADESILIEEYDDEDKTNETRSESRATSTPKRQRSMLSPPFQFEEGDLANTRPKPKRTRVILDDDESSTANLAPDDPPASQSQESLSNASSDKNRLIIVQEEEVIDVSSDSEPDDDVRQQLLQLQPAEVEPMTNERSQENNNPTVAIIVNGVQPIDDQLRSADERAMIKSMEKTNNDDSDNPFDASYYHRMMRQQPPSPQPGLVESMTFEWSQDGFAENNNHPTGVENGGQPIDDEPSGSKSTEEANNSIGDSSDGIEPIDREESNDIGNIPPMEQQNADEYENADKTNNDDRSEIAAIQTQAVSSPEASFESAIATAALSPPVKSHRPRWWSSFIAEIEVENRSDCERRFKCLNDVVNGYDIDWPGLREITDEIRQDQRRVDLLTIELTLRKKGYKRRK